MKKIGNLAKPRLMKKSLLCSIQPKYHPVRVESDWDTLWETHGLYSVNRDLNKKQKRFVMIIPPPNVTGQLHIGHALMCTIQDCLVRWNRMSGNETLWVPGTDHAGIATQTVVETKLRRSQNLSRFDLGRDRFVQAVWAWKEEYGSHICQQIRRLGASVDWSRTFFTLDDKLSKAVTKAFKQLFEQKKIYRAKRFVNWSCSLSTAIADCEVEKIELPKRSIVQVPGHKHKVEFGVIHKFSYKFFDSDEEILIETTRPETILGDVAVAVHPNDGRYKHLVGRFLRHPFHNTKIPLISDAVLVDMEKGTGVVKITPAHDENDFECGERHRLEGIRIFDDDGRINENGGAYRGMMRFDCRFQIIKDLEKMGQYFGKRDFSMVLNICSKSNDVIEPINTSQWWLDCEEMAEKSCTAVRTGELDIIPKREEKTFFNFLENIRPWCISRQLWWGHRIPAYIPTVSGERLDQDIASNWIVAETFQEALTEARRLYGDSLDKIEQEEDVLDTWFSSALLPFTVFGWPEKTEELGRYYPNTVLETGSDILFFWVARMVFMSLQLNGKLPFKTILLHPLVRAPDGTKMSKSKGNIINPLEVIDGVSIEDMCSKLDDSNLDPKQIEKYKKLKKKEFPAGIPACGADALRFSLLCHLNNSNSVNMDIKRVNGYRMFCNKIWQAAIFTFPKIKENVSTTDLKNQNNDNDNLNFDNLENLESLGFADKWILTKMSRTEKTVNEAFENFDLSTAAPSVYDFFLKEFCDVYLELIKPVFNDSTNGLCKENDRKIQTSKVLFFVFNRFLRLFHPFMPFLTEELFQRLLLLSSLDTPQVSDSPFKKENSIMVQKYPLPVPELLFDDVEETMELVLKIVHSIRSVRMVYELGNSPLDSAFIRSSKNQQRLCPLIDCIANLSKVINLKFVDDSFYSEPVSETCSSDVVDADTVIHIQLSGVSNMEAMIKKSKKRHVQLQGLLDSLQRKILAHKSNDNVPEHILQKDLKKEKDSIKELQNLEQNISQLEKIQSAIKKN